MPAKLTRVLFERFQAGGSPLVLLPCELIEGNANKLRQIVTLLAPGQWIRSSVPGGGFANKIFPDRSHPGEFNQPLY
jgi:mannitol-1-phosphate/altronate dehydrogenase